MTTPVGRTALKRSNNKRSNTTYGLMSNEATAVMQREKVAPIGELLVVGRKGVFNLNMLYDWWMLYAVKNNLLVKNATFVMPNETLDALLADEYIKDGARAGTPYRTQTYLRMLGRHLGYDYQLTLGQEQINYLANQEILLRNERKKYPLTK